MKSLAELLLAKLDRILATMGELVDASAIRHDPDQMRRLASKGILAIVPDSTWSPPDDNQRGLQRRILEMWEPWIQQVTLLFSGDTKSRQMEVAEAVARLRLWVERDERDFSVPSNIKDAHEVLLRHASPLYAALRSLGTSPLTILVPDTNVLLRSQDLARYGETLGVKAYVVVLVPGVLAEVDAHKVNHRNEQVRERARKLSSRIKGWRNQGDLGSGVKIEGDVYVRVEGREPDLSKTLSWLDKDVADDRIIASVLELQRREPAARVVLLTGDSVMLAKADGASIPTADTPEPDL